MPLTDQNTIIDVLRETSEKKPHKICSVFPRKIHCIAHWSNGGGYEIPAPKPGEAYSFVEVGPGEHKFDMGNGQRFTARDISSADMARDVIGLSRERQVLNNDTGQLQTVPGRYSSHFTRMGVFVPEGDVPTEQEIAAARAQLIAFFNEKLAEGDVEYQRHKNAAFVEEICRVAAEFLHADRPWIGRIGEVQEKVSCPACREKINRGATKCVHCTSRIGYNRDGVPFEVMQPQPPAAAEGQGNKR